MRTDTMPPMSQGPTVRTDDQIEITADKTQKSGEQEGNATAGNTQADSNTVQAMKQAGTEAKASMKTGEIFLQQQLSEQLGRNGTQFAAPPNIGGGTATVTKSADPGLEKARKEAQVWMDHGNKMLKEHRYNEAIEAYDDRLPHISS